MARVLLFDDAAMNERRRSWLESVVLFALLSALELYVVQELTLTLDYPVHPLFRWFARGYRLVVDVVFWVGISLCLGRRALLVIAAAVAMVVEVTLVSYHYYFHEPLSALTVVNQFDEAWSVRSSLAHLIPLAPAMFLVTCFVTKCVVLRSAASYSPSLRERTRFGLAAACCYVGLFLLADRIDPLARIRGWRTMPRFCLMRGYAGGWFAEWKYLSGPTVLARAIASRTHATDRLSREETTIAIGRHLVIVQVESLGFDLIGAVVDGREVMPFLDRLRDESLFYRVKSPRHHGSADADFVMLSGVPPSPDAITYNIAGYPYDDTLPMFLARMGYEVSALMGDPGRFYNRRPAYEKMGFDHVEFQEELVAQYGLRPDYQGIHDTDLLTVSAARLAVAPPKARVCHFITTVTSHTPFDMLAPAEMELYPHPATFPQQYFNTFHFVDRALREYVARLPADTTLVVYGDHTAGVSAGDYQPDVRGSDNFVPFFIYNLGEDLAARQRTRDLPISTDGSLTVVDMHWYLRHQLHDVTVPVTQVVTRRRHRQTP